jgi:hypothetical protein
VFKCCLIASPDLCYTKYLEIMSSLKTRNFEPDAVLRILALLTLLFIAYFAQN